MSVLVALAFVLLASSSPAVTRLANSRTLTPYDLLVLRCGLGGLLFLPYFIWRIRRLPTSFLAVGFVLAFLQGWGTHATTIAGLQTAPASHASALGPGVVAAWVAFLNWVVFRLRPSREQAIGVVLIVAGALVLLSTSGGSFDAAVIRGDALFLCASLFGAGYLVFMQHHDLSPLDGAAMVSVYSALAVVPWFLIAAPPTRLYGAPMGELVLQVFYQGIVAGALLVVLIGYAVKSLGSQRFGMLVALVPLHSMLFGYLIAGDQIRGLGIVAIAAISIGIAYGVLVDAWRSRDAAADGLQAKGVLGRFPTLPAKPDCAAMDESGTSAVQEGRR